MSQPIIRFFTSNYVNSKCTFSFTSALLANSSMLYDRMDNTRLVSVGSNDTTDEVWDITFPISTTINSIFAKDHNIKSGNIKYWDGAAFVNFSSAISWSANTATDSFFQFTAVATTKIRVTMNTTMVANAQKYINTLFVMNEYGPLSNGYLTNKVGPEDKTTYHEDVINYDSGGAMVIPYGKSFAADVMLGNLNSTDSNLLYTMKNSGRPIIVYPCGGVDQGFYPFRTQDIFLCSIIGSPQIKDTNNLQVYDQMLSIFEAKK